MWDCHIGCLVKLPFGVTKQRIKLGLEFTVAKMQSLWFWGSTSVVVGCWVAVLAEKGPEAKELGSCWNVLSEKIFQYTPVHPLLTSLEDAGWPSPEQQLCFGQICAAHFPV